MAEPERTRKLSNADIDALLAAGILTQEGAEKARKLNVPVTARGARSDVDLTAFRKIVSEWEAGTNGEKKIPVYRLMDGAKLPESALSSSYWTTAGKLETICFGTWKMRPTIRIERHQKSGKDTDQSTIYLVLTPYNAEMLRDRQATLDKRKKKNNPNPPANGQGTMLADDAAPEGSDGEGEE